MRERLDLHINLVEVLGSNAVYFQPPTGTQLTYPCILYRLNDVDSKFADNNPYTLEKEYLLTVIDSNPDTEIPDKVLALPKCSFDRAFASDNMNHFVFRLYF